MSDRKIIEHGNICKCPGCAQRTQAVSPERAAFFEQVSEGVVKCKICGEEVLTNDEVGEEPEIIKPGTIVEDKHTGLVAFATEKPFGRADQVLAKGDTTVAEWDGNEKYADSAPVVNVIPRHLIKYTELTEQKSMEDAIYTYPVPRLSVIESLICETGVPLANLPEPIEGYGACDWCGEGITARMASYITTEEAQYCDIDCYNEALNGP